MATIQHDYSSIDTWIVRVRAEYEEMPDLRLTKPQMQRLWGLDPVTCDVILAVLLHARVLRQRRDGSYVAFNS